MFPKIGEGLQKLVYVVGINKREEINKIKIDGVDNKGIDILHTSHVYFNTGCGCYRDVSTNNIRQNVVNRTGELIEAICKLFRSNLS